MKKKITFSAIVLDWFDKHGRKNLPWQKNIDPYRVWLSEIMLQQTQVKTVIPYFERFIKYFPHIHALASATEDEVLTLWSGLGYYARARNLHKTAQLITQRFDGQFPLDLQTLQQLPGIGRSTAGAILAIAAGQKATILDGNVKRVLTRFHGISTWPSETKTQKKLWEIAEQYTPTLRVAHYTQAMMDLGATVCSKKPNCLLCPLQEKCVGYQTNTTTLYPAKKPKKQLPSRKTVMLILRMGEKVLLKKRPSIGIWGGLWTFPEQDELSCKLKQEKSLFFEKIYQEFGCEIDDFKLWPSFRHTFSHFHLDILPVVVSVKKITNKIMENDQQIWYDLENPAAVGLPAPVKRLLEEF